MPLRITTVSSAVLAVFNPNDGGGLPQTILAGLLLISMLVLLYQEKQIPPWLAAAFGTAFGYFFKTQIDANLEQKK